MSTCSVLWLPVVYYGYLYSTWATCTLLWLPVLYFGYLYSTTAICNLLWLPAVYYSYLPVLYYGYTYNVPSVVPSLLYTATLLCLLGLHYDSLCGAWCLGSTTYLPCFCYCLFYLPIAVYLACSIHYYPVCYA